jgi:hypothetical protein
MVKYVCLKVIADEPSRFIVGTNPAATGLRKLIWGSDRISPSAQMIEAWDFDGDGGLLRVHSAPECAVQERSLPLASLVNLSWGVVREASFSDEDSHYEVRLFFDDSGRPDFLHLPGSTHYLCAFSDQARKIESRLRGFLKPLCPRLENTTWEELVKFWKSPAAGFESLQGTVQTRLTALDSLFPPPESSGSGPPELDQTPNPAAPARELLTQLHSALGRLSQMASEQQRKRAESSGQSTGGYARLIFIMLGLGFIIGFWLLQK